MSMFVCFVLSSSYKRYFYCHDVSGITRWDYPEGPEPEAQPDEPQHRDAGGDIVQLDTIEYQTTVPSSSNAVESPAVDEACPGEPLPPGVEAPLGGALSADILALAGRPPPPPPMTPPDITAAGELTELEEVEPDEAEPTDDAAGSPEEQPLQPTGETAEVRQSLAEISAPPVLNRLPPSPLSTDVDALVMVNSPPTASADLVVAAAMSPSDSAATTSDSTATHQHRERRRKKEKVQRCSLSLPSVKCKVWPN